MTVFKILKNALQCDIISAETTVIPSIYLSKNHISQLIFNCDSTRRSRKLQRPRTWHELRSTTRNKNAFVTRYNATQHWHGWTDRSADETKPHTLPSPLYAFSSFLFLFRVAVFLKSHTDDYW